MPRKLKFGIKIGGFGPDTLTGGDRKDVILGLWGDDSIDGGAGNDHLFGGWGNDSILGAAGSDKIFGGRGFDTAVYEGGIADYDLSGLKVRKWGPIKAKITDKATGDVDSLHGVEALYFAADDYTAYLDGRNNVVSATDDAVTAVADAATTLAGLTDNDLDFDGDALTITAIDTSGLVGSAVLNDDGTITYSADGAFDALAEGDIAETTLTYTVSDGNGSEDTATVTITVEGVNDAPELELAEAISVAENSVSIGAAIGTDVDNGDTLTYTLSGDDAALLAIDPTTGAISFVDAPDFEAPADTDGDNVYDVRVTVTDAGGLAASSDLAVTVTDEDEGPAPKVWINEFHYDNTGTDTGEFIEVAGTAGVDLTGWSLVLYNGSNGTAYNTIALDGALADTAGGFGFDVTNLPSNGLQNGAPDGIALVDAGGAVVEFISYEGSLTAVDGPATGLTSQDVGVAETSSSPVGSSVQRAGVQDEFVWAVSDTANPGAVNDGQTLGTPDPVLFINEFHYDNAGTDTGEFIEVKGTAGQDLTGWSLVLYNGSNGTAYNTIALSGTLADTADGFGFAVTDLPSNGLQNGSPDGIALIAPDGSVGEFLSYEGSFTAADGPAAGVESTDIGAAETSSTDAGLSLQRQDDGTWADPLTETPGAENNSPVVPVATVFFNEFHYDNDGGDVGEFIEVAGTPGADLTGWTIVLYNGSNGTPYNTLSLSGSLVGDGTEGYASVDAPGMQNGAPDGLALVDSEGTVREFLSYEGSLTAVGGPADGMTSTDIGVSEAGDTPAGFSLQRLADGSWSAPVPNTRDRLNDDAPPPPPDGLTLISTVQGAGFASALQGQSVNVEAVVTAVLSNGFYLQEEDSDADADAMTSEGIFVFTEIAPGVAVNDVVYTTGTVTEFFGFTQIEASTLSVIGTAALPTAAGLSLPFTMTETLEAVEGMQVSVAPGAEDAPLTIIETFNFDRFGELVLSEGGQIQPTQIYDAQTEQTEIQELTAANAANRLILDDGNSSQNPDAFPYIANTSAGDDGDGVLSAGDTFTEDGPTLLIGAELTAPVNGVMSYSFGDYKVIPTETLQIDPATNEGARDATPPVVGGELKVASFNVLNYFTTLGERGAFTPEDLIRQTDKIVAALSTLDADVIGIQEVENNGFGADSAVAALVDALNAEMGAGTYAYVDPTTDGGPIGTDAITVGFLYKPDAVTVTGSDFLVFDDGGQQRNRPAIAATFEDADGQRVTIANNHFKSKGASGLDAGDPLNPDSDQGDGQGFWNETRTEAAEQLTAWLETDPTGSGDSDFLIIGDLNAYNEEDPVQAIEAAGYANLIEEFIGAEDAFSFVFNGQQGALDTGLASESLLAQITGVAEWHINSLEPDLLDYNSRFNDPGFYNDDLFRASDHDPLVIGLTLADEFILT